MKKILSIVLAMVLIISMAGCFSKDELNAKQTQIDQLQAQIDALQNAPEANLVYALNATIDGQNMKTITQATTLNAQAVLSEGQVVDHWEVNGEVQAEAKDETFSFTASEHTIVEAVLRPEKKVTTVNCKIRFLNEKNEATGDSYEEFVFEKPYIHPISETEIENGTITVQVKAEIPSGYVLDYWKINGVEYHFANTVNSFIVKDLDEATEYEAVLKEKPITYYKVTCYGGTINGKTELWVPAGTTVTAVCNGGLYAEFCINGTMMNSKWKDPYTKQWTFTVNKDTHVDCYAIIN